MLFLTEGHPKQKRCFLRSLLLVAFVGLSGCAPYWEQTSLRDKVKELEDRVKNLEAAKVKSEQANADRRKELESCVNDADRVYWAYVKVNGREKDDGTTWASGCVWDEARKRKLDKIEECKLLYGTPR